MGFQTGPFTGWGGGASGGGGGGDGGQGGGGGTNAWTNTLPSTFGSFWLAQDTVFHSSLYSEVNDNVSSRVNGTTDGSGSWTDYGTYPPALASPPFPAPTPDFLDAKGTFFVTQTRWYALGVRHSPFSVDPVNIWISVNQGASWTATPIDTAAIGNSTRLFGITGTDANHIFLTCDPTNAGVRSDIDFLPVGGWQTRVISQNSAPPWFMFGAIYDSYYSFPGAIYVAAADQNDLKSSLYFSQGGTFWVQLNAASITRDNELINDIYAANATNIWICTRSTGSDASRIYKTANGGASWTTDYELLGTETAFSSTTSSLTAIHGNSAGSLWCVGQNGIVLRAPNSGSWQVDPVAPAVNQTFCDVKVLPNTVYLASQSSGVWKKSLIP